MGQGEGMHRASLLHQSSNKAADLVKMQSRLSFSLGGGISADLDDYQLFPPTTHTLHPSALLLPNSSASAVKHHQSLKRYFRRGLQSHLSMHIPNKVASLARRDEVRALGSSFDKKSGAHSGAYRPFKNTVLSRDDPGAAPQDAVEPAERVLAYSPASNPVTESKYSSHIAVSKMAVDLTRAGM